MKAASSTATVIAIHLPSCGATNCFAWFAMTMRTNLPRQNNPTGKSAKSCPAAAKKILRLTRRANQRYHSARLTRYEGRCARHERAVGCGGRGSCSRRTQPIADGEVVWSWRPDAGAKFCESHRGATVAKEPGHRGEHEVSHKPSRRESRSDSG